MILNEEDLRVLIAEVEDWKDATGPVGARAYVGSARGWRFLVVAFPIEAGLGHDGTMSKGGTAVRLSRESARLAFEAADKETKR